MCFAARGSATTFCVLFGRVFRPGDRRRPPGGGILNRGPSYRGTWGFLSAPVFRPLSNLPEGCDLLVIPAVPGALDMLAVKPVLKIKIQPFPSAAGFKPRPRR